MCDNTFQIPPSSGHDLLSAEFFNHKTIVSLAIVDLV